VIAATDEDSSRRSPVEAAEEIRRLIAWVLCDMMPPDDVQLRQIYADGVTLDSLGAAHDERLQIAGNIYENFNLLIPVEAMCAWQTIGDIIAFVQSKIENRNSKIS
jgi:acyl carrier protein